MKAIRLLPILCCMLALAYVSFSSSPAYAITAIMKSSSSASNASSAKTVIPNHSNTRGHDTTRLSTAIIAQAKLLGIPVAGPLTTATGADVPFGQIEHNYLCSIQKIIPAGKQPDSLIDTLARQMASKMHRPVDMVRTALKNTAFCKIKTVVTIVKPTQIVIRLNGSGVVISTNPVWNACISGKPLSADLLKSNTDVSHYRRGRMEVTVPLTCSDYHRGAANTWQHPDFPDLALTLDKKGHPVGKLPVGYIAVRDKKITGTGSTINAPIQAK